MTKPSAYLLSRIFTPKAKRNPPGKRKPKPAKKRTTKPGPRLHVLGRLRFLKLHADGRHISIKPTAPVLVKYSENGRNLVIAGEFKHDALRRTLNMHSARAVEINYEHASGGNYTHPFEKTCRARVSKAGITISNIHIKPFIEG